MKNRKGFTLIELLAVITIMGILMLLAIPMVSRVIENSRETNFVDTAKSYVNSAKNLWMSDSLSCDGVAASALHDGDYYIMINTLETAQAQTPQLLENGGKSSWGNKDLNGYIRVNITTIPPVDSDGDGLYEEESKREIKYYVALSDGLHGILDNNTKVAGNIAEKDIIKELSAEEIKKIELTDNYGKLDCALDSDNTYVCTEVTPVTGITAVCTDGYSGVYITGNAKFPPVNFSTDSWETIVDALKSGSHPYRVGDEKEVDLGSFGKHKIRIANLSTPLECAQENFSKTACGVVLEFADIIVTKDMGSGSNSGSWPARSLRTFVNNDIYNALPTDLRNGIISTKVVSGYGGRTGETGNYTSTDKLYFLSTSELWAGGGSGDTASHLSRQLDYYVGANASRYDNPICVKQYNGVNTGWWLRTPYSGNSYLYSLSTSTGGYSNNPFNLVNGVSPAFRISYVEPSVPSPPAGPTPEDYERFENDSWATVITNLKNGTHTYPIGATKEVDLSRYGYGKPRIRLANLSTPAECSRSDFSQTACGIVLEFADVLGLYKMRSDSDTNVGGWSATELKTIANGTFYNSLPSVIRDSIIDTRVVSGHGSTAGESNFILTEKVYVLSLPEIYGADVNDTAISNTRQLDYYSGEGVTKRDFSKAMKKRSGSDYTWWTRTAINFSTTGFVYVDTDGNFDNTGSRQYRGFAPAFRIG